MKNQLVNIEKHILIELGFNVHVQHPHKLVISYLKVLESESLNQKAWNYMNDSFRTNLFCRYQPSVIACASIYLAACDMKVKLPDNPPWWKLFDATFEGNKYKK